jgi:hypothetical protein
VTLVEGAVGDGAAVDGRVVEGEVGAGAAVDGRVVEGEVGAGAAAALVDVVPAVSTMSASV